MTLKFITINVWHGGRLFDNLMEFLKAENPDVIVMQEAYNDPRPELAQRFRTIEEIKTTMGYEYSAFAPCFMHIIPDLKAEEGNAVVSRFPLTEGDTTFFNQPYDDHYIDIPENFPHSSRNLQHVILDTPAGQINVFNFQGVWDLAGARYSPERARMADVIVDAVKGKQNVILAGDTNATPDNKAIARIEEHLTNVFGRELTTSFNMRRKDNPGYATAVVDMIFVSPEFKILSHTCPDVDVTDHLPLITILELPNKAAR